MSDSPWQLSARSSGNLTTRSTSEARQILGTTQPRPFLLSPDKTILDTKVQNRVKLKVPIGLANQNFKNNVIKPEISRPKQAIQLSWSPIRERERENTRRYIEQSKMTMGKNMIPRKPNRPKYIPSPAHTEKLYEKTSKYQKLRCSSTGQANFDLNSKNTQYPRISSSTSSDWSIPDFPVPSDVGPALQSLLSSSSPSAKRAISSFYSSRASSHHTYASSAALPSTYRGSVEMPKTRSNTESHASFNSKSIDSNALDIGIAREYSLLNISNVGIALTRNSEIELRKSRSTDVTNEKKIRPSQVEFKPEEAGSLSLSNNNFEHDLKSRSGRSKEIRYSNLQFPSTSGSNLVNKMKAGDSEFANPFSTKSNNADPFGPITVVQKTRSSPSNFYQPYEAQKSTLRNSNALKQTGPQVSVASLSDLIRCASKFIAQIAGGRKFETRALQNYDYNRTYSKEDIYYGLERDINNRSPTAHLEYGVNQDFLNEEKLISSNFKFPKPAHKNDRFCGLPAINFVALISVLVIIIAAAILIPFFFVLHKQSITSHAKDLELCATTNTSRCQNGGSSFLLDDDTCACICTNNFTGKTCTTNVDSSVCSSIVFAGQRAIIGNSVERLILDAKKNFGIPLNIGLILAHFNTASLSCLAENALVTFNGKSFRGDDSDYKQTRLLATGILKKSELLSNNHFASNIDNFVSNMESTSIVDNIDKSSNLPISSLDSTTTVFVTITPMIIPSIIPSVSSSEDSSTTTVTVTIAPSLTPLVPTPIMSYGPSQTTTKISLAPQFPTPSTFPPIISSSDPPFSTPTPSVSSTLPQSIYVVNEVILDFARVVTLFVLQNTDLTQAINSQTSLQKVFNNKFLSYSSALNYTLSKKPNTITVDLLHLLVDLGDGNGVFGGTVATSNNTS